MKQRPESHKHCKHRAVASSEFEVVRCRGPRYTSNTFTGGFEVGLPVANVILLEAASHGLLGPCPRHELAVQHTDEAIGRLADGDLAADEASRTVKLAA